MNKALLFICCFSAMTVAGEVQDHSVLPRIEAEVASLGVCNKEQPCTIDIEKSHVWIFGACVESSDDQRYGGNQVPAECNVLPVQRAWRAD